MTCITGNGKYFELSPEDADLAQYDWTAVCIKGKYWYVSRRSRPGRMAPKIFLHRLILARIFPKLAIAISSLMADHINGDGLDNRRENLRVTTRTQNRHNSGPDRNSMSNYRGVHWNENRRQWVARIRTNKKDYFLGYFDDKHAAARAWNNKATELYGEFAKLNVIKYA